MWQLIFGCLRSKSLTVYLREIKMVTKSRKTIKLNPLDSLDSSRLGQNKAALPPEAKKPVVRKRSTVKQKVATAVEVAVATPLDKLFESELGSPSRTRTLTTLPVLSLTPQFDREGARRKVIWWARFSIGVSLVPSQLFNFLAVAGLQVKMVQVLCKYYNVNFEHKVVLAVATGLAGSALSQTASRAATKVVARNLPTVGPLLAIAFEPTLTYATTYAIGLTFINHFEAAGNLNDIDEQKFNTNFNENLAKGREMYAEGI